MRTFSGIHCVFTLSMSYFGRCTLKFLSNGPSSPQEFLINHWFWFERFKVITFFLVYRITGNISLHFTLASVSQDEGTRGFNDNQSQSLFSRLLRRTGHKRRARSTKYRGPSQTHYFEELCPLNLSSKVRQGRTLAKDRDGGSISRFP